MKTSVDVESRRTLGVWDTASLLVGIVVGTAIFKAPPFVFTNVETASTGLFVWGFGALLSLCGALCYCELATTYPTFGGEYRYLSQAYGNQTGFLFAWMQLCVILTGSIGAMAFVFADYSVPFLGEQTASKAFIASVAMMSLAMAQAWGFSAGKTIQNLLTASKVVALIAVLIAGLFYHRGDAAQVADVSPVAANWGLALVFVLYAYGGWNDAAMVTPEVRNHQRNMPKALLYGLGFVAVLYIALNLAFLNVLGLNGIRQSSIPAAEVMSLAMGRSAALLISFIVMCSALGAIHGMLFTSCRLLAAVGEDYVFFSRWNQWNKRGVPGTALLTISGISLLLILAVGTASGRELTADAAVSISLPRPDWEKYYGGFDTLIAATAPVFWAFFALSGFAVVVLRLRDAQRPRPFRVPWYPLPVIVFCGAATFMLWKSLEYAGELTLLSTPILLCGIVLSWSRRKSQMMPGQQTD